MINILLCTFYEWMYHKSAVNFDNRFMRTELQMKSKWYRFNSKIDNKRK